VHRPSRDRIEPAHLAPARRAAAARAVGIGWRPELAGDLLATPDAVDLVEVLAEAAASGPARREARAIAEAWPVAVHGVKLSLGSAEGIDLERAGRLGDLAREVRATCISEHIAFVRAGGIEIGHLTALPFTREAVAVVARNVAAARRRLPDVPLLLENVAWSFRWAEDAMDEGDFHCEVAEATGCDLLLDVGNLYANALNAGRDPIRLLERYPLERVAMLHVAGGVLEDGFYFDSHAHPVSNSMFDLVAAALERVGEVPVVLERDGSFPPFAETHAELSRLRAAPRRRRGPVGTRTPLALPPLPASPATMARGGLAAAQAETAARLVDSTCRAVPDLRVARAVLRRKRVDDALSLLPRLAGFGERAVALAARSIAGAPRAPTFAGVADAMHIAEHAAADTDLGAAASADALLLRARYVRHPRGGPLRRRVAPFVGRGLSADGKRRWVLKGIGAEARVHVIPSSGRR
jgi:uncharacterized protein (UPF0276 family)